MLETNTMEQFWKQRYTEADKQRYDYLTLAAKMTGYYGSIAKYDSSVPKQTRIRMLEAMVKFWNEVEDSNSEITQNWIEDCKKEIETLSK